MTIREYITIKLEPLTVSEASIKDLEIETDLDVNQDITIDNTEVVNKAMIGVIEFLLFAPRMSSISESGFSESWDYSDLGKLYLWLCRKYGVTPNDEALGLLGLSIIRDVSDIW